MMAKSTEKKSVKNRTSQKRKTGKRQAEKVEICELKQPIWAVIDETGCRMIDITYDEANNSINKNPGTIITSIAARRIS